MLTLHCSKLILHSYTMRHLSAYSSNRMNLNFSTVFFISSVVFWEIYQKYSRPHPDLEKKFKVILRRSSLSLSKSFTSFPKSPTHEKNLYTKHVVRLFRDKASLLVLQLLCPWTLTRCSLGEKRPKLKIKGMRTNVENFWSFLIVKRSRLTSKPGSFPFNVSDVLLFWWKLSQARVTFVSVHYPKFARFKENYRLENIFLRTN